MIFWVLPSLRRRISCCKSFIISFVRAIRSSSCLARLCLEMTFYSTRGTSFLCLEVTSFSPTRLRCRRWHIGTFTVPWSWSHALQRDCFFPLLYLVPSGVAKICWFFLDGAQVQVETRTLGLLLVVLRDRAWFIAIKWADYEPIGAQNTNPTTHTC